MRHQKSRIRRRWQSLMFCIVLTVSAEATPCPVVNFVGVLDNLADTNGFGSTALAVAHTMGELLKLVVSFLRIFSVMRNECFVENEVMLHWMSGTNRRRSVSGLKVPST